MRARPAATLLLAGATLVCGVAVAATPLQPHHEHEVIEVLQSVTRERPAANLASPTPNDPRRAVYLARQAVQDARHSGDTRYWGRAQAALAPWWDQPGAPVELAVLQATVQQGRHEFDAARQLLIGALAREPGHAQGWLTLAALERLAGRYENSLRACGAVARARQAWYAQACALETRSLQGQLGDAQDGLRRLLAQTTDAAQQSWLLSLLAESAERAGRDAAAQRAYQTSLALRADLYTSIAYSDLLLRRGQTALALKTLAPLPDTDAVLLRRARALQQQHDPRWLDYRTVLHERTQALRQRGDDPALHARELALTALWLDGDARVALYWAQRNLLLQREPLDWWVALQSAGQANDALALAELRRRIAAQGLQDARLGQASSTQVASASAP